MCRERLGPRHAFAGKSQPQGGKQKGRRRSRTNYCSALLWDPDLKLMHYSTLNRFVHKYVLLHTQSV